jgi:hypothetical protein
MTDKFRAIQEKAVAFAAGNQEISEEVYNDILSDIAALGDLEAKAALLKSILASTAFLAALARVTGHNPLHILDNLTIIEDETDNGFF